MPDCRKPCAGFINENIPGYPADGLGLVDFQFVPHFNNDFFPMAEEEKLKNVIKGLKKTDGRTIYICDDNGAVSVDKGIVKVVSEGVVIEEEITG